MYPLSPRARHTLQAVLFTVLAGCLPLSASAALLVTMEATGETQGPIKGGSTDTGREDLIEVVEYGHSLSRAIDLATGQPSGKRQHRPIRIIKPVDQATPRLTQAMVDNEKLTNVVFRFYRPNNSGFEEQYFTVELLNAYIVNVAHSSRTYDGDDWTTGLTSPANETLTLSYQKIIWTWEDGGIASEDDWAQGQP